MTWTPGALIEYSDKDGYALGAVLEDGKSLLVLDARGQKVRVSLKNITAGPLGRGTTAQSIAALAAELDALTTRGDLAEVWELVLMEGEPQTLPALAELLFGEATPVTELAATRLLRAQDIYFRPRRDLWEARPPELVEELRAQRERERAAAREREALAGTVAQLLAASGDRAARRAAFEAARQASGLFAAQMDLLIELAAWQDDAPRRAKAQEVLDALAPTLDAAGVEGKGPAQAFEALVRLGRFSRWENLWMIRYGVRGPFPQDVLQALQARLDELPFLKTQDPAAIEPVGCWRREDLTAIPVVTIDAPSTLDIDDGVSLAPRPGGGWSLGIHIADPASVVPQGHPLDEEARRRGTSVYMPGLTVPMFPLALSEGAVSLLEGQLRPAMSYLVELDDALQIQDWRLAASWVRVRHRMSYAQVDAILAGEEEHPQREMLAGLDAVSKALKRRRLERGAVIMSFPDADITLEGERDEEGRLWELTSVEVSPAEREASRHLIGELMILVGELTGLYTARHQLPALYRIQAPPVNPDGEVPPMTGRELDLLESFELRRFMQRGEVRTHVGAHFGLGLEAYVQATSPIRRYGDLVHHRQLQAHLLGEPLPYDEAQIVAVAGQVDLLASDAATVQRETTRFWKLVWLHQHKDEPLTGIAIQHPRDRSDRAIVVVETLGLTTQVALTESAALGDRLLLKVDQVRPRRDTFSLRMVGRA